MRPKTVFLMAVAVGAGLVAAFLASLYHPTDTTRTTLVTVAAGDLQIGTPIEPEKHLQLRPFLPDSVPQGAVSNIEDLRGKVLGRNIPQNTPVTTRDLNLNGELLASAPKGTRAVTIRVTLENAQGGFTLPGAHVDLVCTLNDLRDGRRTLTKTFMQHVLVLAVNTHSQATNTDKGVIANPATVTLAVKPQEAQRIIWAKERGSITMTLRKPDDKEIVTTVETYDPFAEPDKTKPVETVRILVARKEIRPNTPIDNVAEYFEAINYPADLARDAIQEKDLDRLNKQMVCHYVPEGFPVTLGHLRLVEEDFPGRAAVSWLGIQVSDKPPRYYKFIKGRSAGHPNEDAGPDSDRTAPPTPKRDE